MREGSVALPPMRRRSFRPMSDGAATGSTSNRPNGDQTSNHVRCRWSGSASADTPDNVVVYARKASYKGGDEPSWPFASPLRGKATIGHRRRQKSRQFIDIDLVNGDNVAPFKVGADWGGGAYARRASPIAPLDAKAKRMPAARSALAWFGIEEMP